MDAKLFFIFLNEAYRLDAEEKLQQIGVASTSMGGDHVKEIVDGYKKQARSTQDMLESLKPNTNYDGIEQLKEFLGG